ncbi:MAG: DNA polymerase III subunit alpha [Candidatus Liptonbacteria bacterium]|nr:DNA polymerase III subunit alpha [Candidatus Liptonbacteria bacterium]
MGKFVHLHTHSHYSLLDGLAKIEDLVGRAKELEMDALALTDHGVLYGAIEFYKKAKAAGIKPILGVEAYIAPKDRRSRDAGEKYYHLILLSENITGWKNLIKLVTKANLEGFYYKPRMDKDLLREYHEGIIALSACFTGEIQRAINEDKDTDAVLKEYVDIFGKENFFLEIGYHPHVSPKQHEKVWNGLIALSKRSGIPLAATQDIHYAHPDDREYHDVLLAVQTGSNLSDGDRLTLKADNFSMTSPEEMEKNFKNIPEAVTNTVKIAERCNVELELGKTQLPDFPKPEGKTANQYLRELAYERLPNRFSKEAQTQEVLDRLEYELGVIEKTGFADYFLIVQDLTGWARAHGIAVGPGRGSAAGSLMSYVLGITDINPLRYGLLFERFLNPERIQMPDIDIDFADTRRDEVLAYARQKYGEDRVAQIITFGTMAARAAVRDAGRAMGLQYGFCDQIAKLIPFNATIEESLEQVPELLELYKKTPDAKRVMDTAKHLEGVARHASVHACGTVISKKSLTEYLPLQYAPQDKNAIITQFEMHSVEDLGLLKMDLLGLKNLTIIEETIRLVKDLRGEEIQISNLPLDDKATFTLLQAGNTTGVFQFESSGMRRYMKEIHPTELEDLIALVALFRPGPMELIPTFIKRKHGLEKITYLHPHLEPILKTTYGIGVYQEQMMQIARDVAGYTLPEADTLRKAIGKKIKSLLDEQKSKLVNGMVKNGIPPKIAEAIWELFPPFARYGFNKSHAACYALIGYQTAYLKAHYPIEYMAALLNADLNDLDRISFLVNEAKQNNIPVLAPDVNKSFVKFAPEEGKIRFGLLGIKNVGSQIAHAIIEERIKGGAFQTFTDFLARIQHKDLNKKSLESLAKGGALESLGVERNQVIQNLDDIVRFAGAARKTAGQSNSLFGSSTASLSIKLKPAPPATREEKLGWEKELLGFYLSDHPLNSYKEKINWLKAKPLHEVRAIKDETKTFRAAGLVSTIKKILTKNGEPMLFATLEDFSPQPLEVIVFTKTLAKTEAAWQENNVVILQGRMSWRNGEPKIICDDAKKLEA